MLHLSNSIDPILTRPSPPRRPSPAGACDCHAHLFGPFEEFPLPASSEAKATFAPFDLYCAMLARIGFERAVLVQPSAYGQDCRALLAALRRAPRTTRGVAVKNRLVTDAELADLHSAGVRGLRFNLLARGATGVGIAELSALAPRLREIGWHAQIYATCEEIAEMLPRLTPLGLPLVFDHLARVGPGQRTLEDPAFRAVANAVRGGLAWIKLTAYRTGLAPPSFDDVRPFHCEFIAANPDRMVWGSDWPFLSAIDDPPDAGHLLDKFNEWMDDESLRVKILVTNPTILYGFATRST